MDDHNNKRVQSLNDRALFLLDTSAFQIFEQWGKRLGFDLLEKIQQSGTHYYFLTNSVWVELHQKRSEVQMNLQLPFILNTEGSFSSDVKFSSFPIEIDGKIVVLPTNATSAEDFSQVWLCANHPELTIISNDRKLLKTAGLVLKGRVMGPTTFIEDFIKSNSSDLDLKGIQGMIASMELKKVFK